MPKLMLILQAIFYQFHNVSESGKFIVVYPQGVIRVKGAAEWDPGDNSSTNINDNDLFFTEKLIEDIDETYNIDSVSYTHLRAHET